MKELSEQDRVFCHPRNTRSNFDLTALDHKKMMELEFYMQIACIYFVYLLSVT